ncbi:MAG: Stp1/IreP family PP2C-type Ser/Thr phosphatase [Bradymonadaceae bacterium]|nr:Stp1/IreP family PP2C-type Ser/Thr phosphatase [Lujinxingiaceae bacterium]
MELQFWASTNVGRVREHNEDNFLVDKRLQLFVVCDGMGGHAAGEVASAVCVRTVRDIVAAEREVLTALENDPDDFDTRQAMLSLLERAIKQACAQIFKMSAEDATRRGMGTTCSMLLISGDRAFIGHVGDSRVYVVREGVVSQITEDHSLLNEMIRQGKLKPGDNHDFPHKNAVTRAVGVKEFVEVDTLEIELEDHDRFLLCSDGLSGYFNRDEEILDLTAGDDLKDITQRCIAFANEGGGKDNITVILIDTLLAEGAAQADDSARVIEILQHTPYFHYLNNKELLKIVSLAERREYEAESLALGPQETAERLNILLQGSIALYLNGRQIGVLNPGDHFGELSFIDEQPESVTVRALEATVLMSVGRDQFMGLLRSDPQLAIKLLWNFLQVFSGKLRQVPYDFLRDPDLWWARMEQNIEEATPPSGRLVFIEDARPVGNPSQAEQALANEATRPLSRQHVAKIAANVYDSGKSAPFSLAESTEAPWEDGKLVDDMGDIEDLRATIQLDWSSAQSGKLSEAAAIAAQAAAARQPQRSTPPPKPPPTPPAALPGRAPVSLSNVPTSPMPPSIPEPTTERPISKGVSGVSVVQKTKVPKDAGPPRSAVLKRGGESVAPASVSKIEISSDLLGDDEGAPTKSMARPSIKTQRGDNKSDGKPDDFS